MLWGSKLDLRTSALYGLHISDVHGLSTSNSAFSQIERHVTQGWQQDEPCQKKSLGVLIIWLISYLLYHHD